MFHQTELTQSKIELSILILVINEAESLKTLLDDINLELISLETSYEVVVVDGGSTDGTQEIAKQKGARLVEQRVPGYGEALKQGFKETKGKYVITLDGDSSHPPKLVSVLWSFREEADLIIASRYVEGGSSSAPLFRRFSSSLLSKVFGRALSLPVRDISSGYRLYSRRILRSDRYAGKDFDILLEVLIRAVCEGYTTKEISLNYQNRLGGKSHVRLIKFALSYFKQLFRMWRLRNSVESADYDHRAYDSCIFLQRYWQRKRYQIVMDYLGDLRGRILDIGCGSSRIIQKLPDAVALDIAMHKLRFLKNSNKLILRGSTFNLPFPDNTFECIIHSEVLEHISLDPKIFNELNRVLKINSILVVGTPDYGRIWWPTIEFFYSKILPDAYAQEHITHYTKDSLFKILSTHGFQVQEHKYILGGELIVKAIKIREL